MHSGMDIKALATSLRNYIHAYQDEYRILTATGAHGDGFPALHQSPFVTSQTLICQVLDDGLLLMDTSTEPDGHWYATGGPAIKVDYPHTRMPLQIRVMLGMRGAHNLPQRVYRAVTQRIIPNEVWCGDFGTPTESLKTEIQSGIRIQINRYSMTLQEALRRATYGFLGDIIDYKECHPNVPGEPTEIAREIGFLPADLNSRRFYNYLAIDTSKDPEHWNTRTENRIVCRNARRDFARVIAMQHFNDKDSIAQITDNLLWVKRFHEMLHGYAKAIKRLETILSDHNSDLPSAVDKLISNHTVILDPYARCVNSINNTTTARSAASYPTNQSHTSLILLRPNQHCKIYLLAPPGTEKLNINSMKLLIEEAEAMTRPNRRQFTEKTRNSTQTNHSLTLKFSVVQIELCTPHNLDSGKCRKDQNPAFISTPEHELITLDELLISAKKEYNRLIKLVPYIE